MLSLCVHVRHRALACGLHTRRLARHGLVSLACRLPRVSVRVCVGCVGQGKEYRGERAGDQNDEMCVMVRAPEIKVSLSLAEPKTP